MLLHLILVRTHLVVRFLQIYIFGDGKKNFHKVTRRWIEAIPARWIPDDPVDLRERNV